MVRILDQVFSFWLRDGFGFGSQERTWRGIGWEGGRVAFELSLQDLGSYELNMSDECMVKSVSFLE